MASRRQKIGAVLGGSAVLAFGGYTLGSQSGDGVATGAGSGERSGERGMGPPGFGHGLDDLAERLGVEPDALEQALEDMREERADEGERPGDPHERLSAGLAEKLGLSEQEVEEAFDKLHDSRHSGLASALADELNLEAEDVEAALEKALPMRPRGGQGGPPRARRAPLRRLARELGVSTSQLRNAFMAIRPDKERGHFGPDAAELADALGKSEDEVQTALDELREEHEAEHDARRDEFASELAERLGISADKVKEELPEFGPGPFGGPGGPGGPPHGGPGGPPGGPPGGMPMGPPGGFRGP